jgi:CelD/BcsL family acetyltransferase involved in cellulose biosynthesis
MTSLAYAPNMTFALEPLPHLDSLERMWRGFDQTGSHSFFLTWTWMGTWLRSLPPSVTPLLLKATRGSNTVGLALLTPRRHAQWRLFPVNQAWLNSAGDPKLDCITIEHNGFAVPGIWDDRWWLDLVEWFGVETGFADEMVLSGVASESLSRKISDRSFTQQRDPAFRTLLHSITPDKGIEPLLSRNARQQLRRSIRAYTHDEPLRVDVAPDVESGLEYFSRLKSLHVRSWTRRGRRSAFDHPFFETFHRALITAGFGEGNIDLLRVSAGTNILGYLYNFRRNGTVYSYQSGFDDSTPKMRPGYVCHALAMAYYAAGGMSTYDFLAGSNQLKRSFGTEQYQLCWSHIRKPTIAFRAEQFARSTLGLLKRRNGQP